jgi:diketogulonate reductase-like aldo/keto reductase
MEELVDAGLVKAIGVANFTTALLHDLLSYARIKPAVNQVELHPYLQQRQLLRYCAAQGIVVEAYSPLGSPGSNCGTVAPAVLQDATLRRIAAAHNKSVAQVCLKWGVQRGTGT